VFNTFGEIHVEHINRRPTDSGEAGEFGTVPREVLLSGVPAGIEQAGELAGYRIDPGDVRSLVEVVVVAGESEVFGGSRTVVFYGNDMVDLEGQDVEPLG
jgi:hypothetical protein